MVDEMVIWNDQWIENKPNPRNKRDTLQAIITKKRKREMNLDISSTNISSHDQPFHLKPKIKSSPIFSIASNEQKKEKNNYKRYTW